MLKISSPKTESRVDRWVERGLAKTRRRFLHWRPHEKSYTELSLKFQPGPFISRLRGLLSPRVLCIAVKESGGASVQPEETLRGRGVRVRGGARTLPPCPITISREGILSNIITSPLWIARPFYRFRERRRARATPGAVDARPAPSRVSSWAKIWGEEGRRVGRRIPSASRPWIPRVPRFRRANEIRGTIYKAGNCKRVLITIAKNIARFGSSKRRNSTRFHVRRLSRATVAPRYRPFSRSSLNREWCDLQRVLRLAHGEWEREKLSGWILDRKVLFAGLIEFSKRWQDVVFDSCYW